MRSEAGRFTEMWSGVAAAFRAPPRRLRIAGERLRDLVRFFAWK